MKQKISILLLIACSSIVFFIYSCEKKKCTLAPQNMKPKVEHILGTPESITKSESISNAENNTASKTIIVHNKITDKMLKYKHWTGTYKPSKFIITFNGIAIEQDTHKKIPVTNNMLTVNYEYEFMGGMRKGTKEVVLTLDKDAKSADITFSWKDNWHVLADSATPVSIKEI